MITRVRLEERLALRRQERRRRRGGPGRGPVVLQRTARGIVAGVQALRRGAGRLVAGDRPLAAMVLVAIAVAVLLVSGPAQQYLSGSARVETLAAKAEALAEENDRLEQRREGLHDPATIELLAREHQGFARVGEVPYTLVPPPVDRPVITSPRDDEAPSEPTPWYRRVLDLLEHLRR